MLNPHITIADIFCNAINLDQRVISVLKKEPHWSCPAIVSNSIPMLGSKSDYNLLETNFTQDIAGMMYDEFTSK